MASSSELASGRALGSMGEREESSGAFRLYARVNFVDESDLLEGLT
jgi:hypothetical protein